LNSTGHRKRNFDNSQMMTTQISHLMRRREIEKRYNKNDEQIDRYIDRMIGY